MSGDMRYANVPRDPLETHLASPYRVLAQGPCAALSPRPDRAFAVLRSGKAICVHRLLARSSPVPHCVRGRDPFASPRRTI